MFISFWGQVNSPPVLVAQPDKNLQMEPKKWSENGFDVVRKTQSVWFPRMNELKN